MKVFDKRATMHCSAVLDEESDEASHRRIEFAFRDIELSHEEHALRKMRDDLGSPVDCVERDDGSVVRMNGILQIWVRGRDEFVV